MGGNLIGFPFLKPGLFFDSKMDGNVIEFPFLNPGLHFAYQLRNLLFPSHVYEFPFKEMEDVKDDIPFPYGFEWEQRILHQALKSRGLEDRFIDLTQPCREIQEMDTTSMDIETIKYSSVGLPVLSRINTTHIPAHHVHKRVYWYDTGKNKKLLRSPPRKHVRGPRRFTSIFETFRTIFS